MTDVGDVDHVPDRQALEHQRPLEGVCEHVGSHVADVLVGVDGRSARVHPDLAGPGWLEPGDFAGQGVEEAQWAAVNVHGPTRYRPAGLGYLPVSHYSRLSMVVGRRSPSSRT